MHWIQFPSRFWVGAESSPRASFSPPPTQMKVLLKFLPPPRWHLALLRRTQRKYDFQRRQVVGLPWHSLGRSSMIVSVSMVDARKFRAEGTNPYGPYDMGAHNRPWRNSPRIIFCATREWHQLCESFFGCLAHIWPLWKADDISLEVQWNYSMP